MEQKQLTSTEMSYSRDLVRLMKSHGRTKPITAKNIVQELNKKKKGDVPLTGRMLRNIIHSIRANSEHPIVANTNGFFYTKNKDDIKTHINNVKSKAASLNAVARGLQRFIK